MSTSAPPPRTLADALRARSTDDLGALLDARPDLATPAPHDSSQLASRAVVRTSVMRALDTLDTCELAVLTALVQLGQVGVDEVAAVVDAKPDSVRAALQRLELVALVWGSPPTPVSVVTDLLRLPPGPDQHTVMDAVAELSGPARGVLDHLDQAGADGRFNGVRDRSTPTGELLAHGLLASRSERTVTIPWSVRLALHQGRSTPGPVDQLPELATSARGQAMVERAGAGAAFDFVRRTELLLDHWGTHPPAALKGGGLAVRDLKATTELLHVEVPVAALVIETAHMAGLLDQGMTDDHDAAWLPTEAFDSWLQASTASRWTTLARAWLGNPRLVSAIGGRVADKPVNALSPDLARSWLVALRHDLLAELTPIGPGEVLAAGTGVASVVSRMRWRRPRRPASRVAVVESIVDEAAVLGVTGLDGLTDFGRALCAGEDPSELLAGLLPTPVDHVLLQADLTAIAPGPLEQDLARRLALVADVESRGGATVYRFAATSVRRAFDAGWSAAEVHEFVAETSRTPVPQALTYLIDDVSRRFGTLRVGHAEAFLRSDDETALTELVHHPAAASLRLRRIAPTVVISDMPLATLLPRIRELGLAPVVEAADGTVRVARPDVYRARTPTRRPSAAREVARAGARTSAVVAAVRAGDRAAASRPRRTEAATPADLIALLRQAGESSQQVVIGYVGNDGTVAERIVDPLRVEGGQLTAYDERSDSERTFALHRITAARAFAE